MDYCIEVISTALLVLASISGVFPDISPSCLHCLSKANPVPAELGCIEFGARTLCGPFRISDGFYIDCRVRFTPPPGLDDFRNCTLNYDCAAACVEAYHNVVSQPVCLKAIQLMDPDYMELTCLDYGRTHALGIHSCGMDHSESPFWQKYKLNMTENCGCRVVYGSCTTPTTLVTSSTTESGPTTEQLILYTVPAACAIILIIVVILCAVVLRGYAKRKRQRAEIENRMVEPKAAKKQVIPISKQTQAVTGDQHQSQYNPYTANPQNGRGNSLAAVVESQQDTEDYMSPSRDLPSVLLTSSSDSLSQLTLLVRQCETDKSNDATCDYVYDQAISANPESCEGGQRATTTDLSSPLPDYVNSADVASSFDPPYINGKCQASLFEEKQQQELFRAKAPIPAPRDSDSTKRKGPPLDRMPSGLYVEEVNVGDNCHPNKDQYVIPEERYGNQQI